MYKYLIALLLSVGMVTAQPVINEVYYNPTGNENGGEFIELYNPGSEAYNLSGLVIATGSSAQDATLPAVLLPAKSSFLVADVAWDTAKDITTWPAADHYEDLTLANTQSGVALIKNGQTLDAVGWGSEDQYFEGSPHPGVAEGKSLVRTQDTNDNAADFSEADPSPTNKKPAIEGQQVKIEFEVLQFTLDILEIQITDEDPTNAGVQIYPQPNSNKQVPVTVTVNGSGQSATVLFNDQSILLTPANNSFRGNISIPYSLSAGNYTLNVTLTNAQGISVSKHSMLQIHELVAFAIDTTQVNFSSSLPGKQITSVGDLDMDTSDKITIKNIGNAILDLSLTGEVPSSGSSTLPVENIKYQFLNNLFSGSLSTSATEIPLGLTPGTKEGLSLTLALPSSASAGKYTSTIYLTGAAQ